MDARGHSLGFAKSSRISIINRWPWRRGPGKVSEKDGWCAPRKMVGAIPPRFDQDSSNVATILVRSMVSSCKLGFSLKKRSPSSKSLSSYIPTPISQLAALESLRVRNNSLSLSSNATIKRITMCFAQSVNRRSITDKNMSHSLAKSINIFWHFKILVLKYLIDCQLFIFEINFFNY